MEYWVVDDNDLSLGPFPSWEEAKARADEENAGRSRPCHFVRSDDQLAEAARLAEEPE